MPSATLSQPAKIPLWLDCDPGHDDAFAILLAAHHPALNLLGLSTVHGNASLARTTHNALSILTALGRTDVPVYPGASKPSSRAEAIYAPGIHGPSGLDGTALLPTPTVPAVTDVDAILAMRTALLAQPAGTPWLVATGALTNVAALFSRFPDVAGHIAGLSIMGGAVGGGFTDARMGTVGGGEWEERIGNVTRWAEFNVYCDPPAAQLLFRNAQLAPKTTLVPLDLTHQVLATKDVLRRLLYRSPPSSSTSPSTSASALISTSTSTPTAPPTPAPPVAERQPSTLRHMLHDLLTFFAHTYADVFGMRDGPPLHDPLAVAVLLDDHGHGPARDGAIAIATTACAAGAGAGAGGGGGGGRVTFSDRCGERWSVDVVVTEEGSEPCGEGEGDGDGNSNGEADGDVDADRDGRRGRGKGKGQVGRTMVTRLERGTPGVRIPRAVDMVAFWDVLEGCVRRAEEGMGMR